MANVPLPIHERLWAKVREADSGCWEWMGYLQTEGYGQIWTTAEGRRYGALVHRLSYEQMVGEVPAGLVLDHLCRNRRCVNPSHLEPVPFAENVLRGMGFSARNARKTECVRGHLYDSVNTVLTPDGRRDCRQCRRDRAARFNARRKKVA